MFIGPVILFRYTAPFQDFLEGNTQDTGASFLNTANLR